jgi:hypothetical protein
MILRCLTCSFITSQQCNLSQHCTQLLWINLCLSELNGTPIDSAVLTWTGSYLTHALTHGFAAYSFHRHDTVRKNLRIFAATSVFHDESVEHCRRAAHRTSDAIPPIFCDNVFTSIIWMTVVTLYYCTCDCKFPVYSKTEYPFLFCVFWGPNMWSFPFLFF